ncbi:MAG: TrmH family RNA methyltransferase [Parachlamydiaceae bacterium]
MDEFTKPRFLALASKTQQKVLAKLLNEVYHSMISRKLSPKAKVLYELYASWLDTLHSGVPNWECKKSIADRYHFHLRQAHLSDNETYLIDDITHFDRETAEEAWPIGVYLDQLRSAHNVGSILRTVEGFGLKQVYFSEDTPWIEHKQVQKTSRNAYLHVKCSKTHLKSLPRPLIALETMDRASSIYQFSFPNAFTLIVGNEEYGCSNDTLKAADHFIQIPLRGRKNSLNVANAFAIAASEIARQRIVNYESR